MFERVLQDLGITPERVRGAIKNLVEGNPALKAELRPLLGGAEFKPVGTVNGQEVFVKA